MATITSSSPCRHMSRHWSRGGVYPLTLYLGFWLVLINRQCEKLYSRTQEWPFSYLIYFVILWELSGGGKDYKIMKLYELKKSFRITPFFSDLFLSWYSIVLTIWEKKTIWHTGLHIYSCLFSLTASSWHANLIAYIAVKSSKRTQCIIDSHSFINWSFQKY